MSVRVTGRLIGDLVVASGLSNSPKMIVQSIDEEAKTVRTIWFSDSRESQEGMFPGSALDRAELPKAPKEKAAKEKKAAPRGRGRKSGK